MMMDRRRITTIVKHDRRMQTDPTTGVEFGEVGGARKLERSDDDALMGREACVIRFTYVCRSATLLFLYFFFSFARERARREAVCQSASVAREKFAER